MLKEQFGQKIVKEKRGIRGNKKNGANGALETGRGTRAQKFKRDGTGRGTLSPCPVADPRLTFSPTGEFAKK